MAAASQASDASASELAAAVQLIEATNLAKLAAVDERGIGQQVQAVDASTLDINNDGHFWQQPAEAEAFALSLKLPAQPPAPLYAPLRQLLLDSLPTLPADLIDLISSYSLQLHLPLFITPQVGRRYWDSVPFCTETGYILALQLAGFTIRQLIGWGDEYANGIGFVLGPARMPLSDDANVDGAAGFVTLKSKFGRHHQPRESHFILHEDEFVRSVELFAGEWADSLRFETSEGRSFRVGRSEGGQRIAMSAPPDTALVGLLGSVGGHVHSIGCVWASTIAHRQQTAAAAASPSPDK